MVSIIAKDIGYFIALNTCVHCTGFVVAGVTNMIAQTLLSSWGKPSISYQGRSVILSPKGIAGDVIAFGAGLVVSIYMCYHVFIVEDKKIWMVCTICPFYGVAVSNFYRY